MWLVVAYSFLCCAVVAATVSYDRHKLRKQRLDRRINQAGDSLVSIVIEGDFVRLDQ